MVTSACKIAGRVVFIRDSGQNGPGDAEVIRQGGHQAETSGYKRNRSTGYNAQHGNCSVQRRPANLEVAKRVHLESSHKKKKNLQLHTVTDVN